MKSFLKFLNEEISKMKSLTHLEHPEDMIFDHGTEGFHHAIGALKSVDEKLKGKVSTTRVTEKYDGAPSIVFGHDPKNGKFFVATKAAFNKNPKINYTDEDIEKNHGHAPGLVAKLKEALHHLPKSAPKQGVYQGDLMHTPDDVHDHDGKYHFTPNTVMYSTPKKSEEGKKIAGSKVGVVVHSKYHGPSLDNMHVGFEPDLHNFKQHKDVHLINPEIQAGGMQTSQHTVQFEHHIKRAEKEMEAAHPDTFHTIVSHAPTLRTYINKTIRDGSSPSTAGYRKHLMDIGQKEVEGVKTASKKQEKHDKMMGHLGYVEQHAKHFDSAFKIHHHIQKAKDALVHSLESSSPYEHFINGKPTAPEGFVSLHNDHPVKLVNRAEFSRQNFAKHNE